MKIARAVLMEDEVIGLELYPAMKLRCRADNTPNPHVIKTQNRKHGTYVEKIFSSLGKGAPSHSAILGGLVVDGISVPYD